MKKKIAIGLSVLLTLATVVHFSSPPTLAQKRQRVELPEGTVLDAGARPVISLDGSVGFLAPALGDTVIAFDMRTGKVIGQLSGYGAASGISLSDNGKRRLLTVTAVNDPANGLAATI